MNYTCILNELSLHGQYSDSEDFFSTGASDFAFILKGLKEHNIDVLYKKTDIYNFPVTNKIKLNEVLFLKDNRINDSLKRLKSALSNIQNEPYWDLNPKQDYNSIYLLVANKLANNLIVTKTGIAEAYARKAITISFNQSNYSDLPLLNVKKDDGNCERIRNISSYKQLIDLLFDDGLTTSEYFITSKFSKKLNFSRINRNYGFNLINKENIHLFVSTFSIIEQTPWQLMRMNEGLDYKEFNKNRKTQRFFTSDEWSKTIMKFRVTDEIRCFGNVEKDKLYILRIDLNHKLSDLG